MSTGTDIPDEYVAITPSNTSRQSGLRGLRILTDGNLQFSTEKMGVAMLTVPVLAGQVWTGYFVYVGVDTTASVVGIK